MTKKVTGIRLDWSGKKMKVIGMGQTNRGTKVIIRVIELDKQPLYKAEEKADRAVAIASLLPSAPLTG